MKNAKYSLRKTIFSSALVIFFTHPSIIFSAQNAPLTSAVKEKSTLENDIIKAAQLKHGPDGALFLLPYLLPYLQNLKDCTLLDAGCGPGVWSVLAAKNGAMVYGIDIQESMIVLAKQAAKTAGLSDDAAFTVGDVGRLPYLDNFFDRAISINVGCNLPSLENHMKELHRVLKKGGLAIVTTPTSLGFVFTDGKKPQEQIIKEVKTAIHKNPSELSFKAAIQEFNEIYRATFMKRKGKWELVQNENDLIKGEKIWRKIPQMTSANFYHPIHEYFSVFELYGFSVKRVETPHFHTEKERLEYNNSNQPSLGSSYTTSPPFIIFVIEKK